MAVMDTGETTAALCELRGPDGEIFDRLISGVNEVLWLDFADTLRHQGYGVFDLRVTGKGNIEIISPDCLNWWQLSVDTGGCCRLC